MEHLNEIQLSEGEAANLLLNMKQHASEIPLGATSEQVWNNLIESPVGTVIFGKNQKSKFKEKKREGQIRMAVETINRPDIILEEKDLSGNNNHERKSSFLFVKTFKKKDTNSFTHFESVTVAQEGQEVSISSHMIRENQLKKKMKSDRLLYIATALDESATSSAEQPMQVGSLPSECKDKGLHSK